MNLRRPMLWGAFAALLGTTTFATAQSRADFAALQTGAIQSLESSVPGLKTFREGDCISRIYGAPFAFGRSATESAQSFLNAHPNALGGGVANYVYEGEQDLMTGKFTAVCFNQFVNGVPVDLGGVTLLVRNESNFPLVLAVNSSETVAPIGTKPIFTEAMAIEAVAKQNARLTMFSSPALAIHRGESENRLAWQFEAESPSLSQPEKFKVFVDAITGEIIEWRDLICYADVTGSVRGYATPGLLPDQGNNPAVLTNLFGAKTTIAGVSTAYTDSAGNFTLSNPGTTPVTVNSTLEGRWVRVVDNTSTTLAFAPTVTPPGPADFVYNGAPSVMTTSQVNGLIHTTIVHDFVKSVNASYPGVDIQMPCNVNVAGQGNAFYNGSSINFYNAGGGYPNTCYSTVV